MLHAKTSIVTGANRGIGRAILETFAANGSDLIACARRIDDDFVADCAALAGRHGVAVVPVQLDLLDQDSIRSALQSIHALRRDVDVLVNNAGAAVGGLYQMSPMDRWRETFEVNLFGPLQFTQGIVRLMSRRGAGSIVNIASTAAFVADPGTSAYGSSKCALVRATRSMAVELGGGGIRVNAIAPGVTRTDMLEEMDPQARDRLVAMSAMKRPAEPDEIAAVALFFASGLSGFVNGQTLRVDGGMA